MYKKIISTLYWIGFSGIIYANPVDINTADVDTIIAGSNGIGQTKARAIVNYREQHGPFTTVDDLTKVLGIGKKLLDQNRNNFTVSAPENKSAKPNLNQPVTAPPKVN